MSSEDSGTASRLAEDNDGEVAHHALVAQPHDEAEEGTIAEAEVVAAEMATEEQPLGKLGKPLNRRSPFIVGMTAAAGVAVTVGLVAMVVAARDVLVLIGLALFIAIGLEPAVSFVARRGAPRWAAVVTVCVGLLGAVVAFFAAAIPPLAAQATAFVQQVPEFVRAAQDQDSWVGQLNQRFDVQRRVEEALGSDGTALVGGLLGAGAIVLGALVSALLVVVLVVYFLIDMPRIRQAMYRLVPNSRRPRVILIGDAIFAKVGGFVLGNVLISLIAGTLTFIWLVIFGVPYPLLLAIFVALLDVIPVIGATVAGVVVSLVALTVSVPVALATVGFFVVYRFVEDYLLLPKIMGRTVQVPALVTVVGVVLGGFLLGLIGAIVAIPVAAAVLLIINEVAVPRLDRA